MVWVAGLESVYHKALETNGYVKKKKTVIVIIDTEDILLTSCKWIYVLDKKNNSVTVEPNHYNDAD